MQKMKEQTIGWKLPLVALLSVIMLLTAGNGRAMTRTIKKEPAIVIAAFGTTTKARVTYEFFDAQPPQGVA